MIEDLGGERVEVWLPVSNTLVLAAICPFTGYLQDLFGHRRTTLFGSVLIMVGIVRSNCRRARSSGDRHEQSPFLLCTRDIYTLTIPGVCTDVSEM
jgi:MFS family permease